ncbi:MAG: hypothetical protein AAF721_36180 [Myxococcota bacterium]
MACRPAFIVFGFVLLGCPSDDPEPSASDGSTSNGAADSSTGMPAPGSGSSSGGAADDESTTAAGDTQGASGSTAAGGLCIDEFPAIVTDIDETLTLSDDEFAMQLQDGNYDPVAREGAGEMVNAYADLGYRILYLTARSETFVTAVTDETGREATERWLEEHGYPTDEETTELVLAPQLFVGDATRMYKGDAIMEFQAMGWRFDYAYGNALTDIGGYEDAGIAKDATFIIGEEAGAEGTVAIEGEDWLEHNDTHLPTVPDACGGA